MTVPLRQPLSTSNAASIAAQLVWIGFPGPEIDDETAALLERGIGGVVLFSANITGVEQLVELTAELRRLARGPLRIAIDHEGGHVVRIGAPLTRFPSAMAVGATGSEELARAVGRAAGEELAALGIDVNLAPVLDVALDPRNASVGARSFGSSPELVARLGAAMVRGYREAGVAATAKHFPGHGRTPVDSHLALPSVAGGLDELRRSDLPPFRAAIAAGVELVMISHVAYEELTDGLPSTLSARVMRDLLRGELRFDGLVVTDAMVMRALVDRHPIPAACVRSIAGGADVVMPLDRQPEVVDALASAIDSGELPAARVTDALERVARLDARLAASAGRPRMALPDAQHAELARTVARRSVTLLSGEDVLPLSAATSVAVVDFASRRPSPIEDGAVPTASLAAALRRQLARVNEVVVEATDIDAAGRAAVAAAAAADFVIVATRDAHLWAEEQELIARLASAGRPSMLICLRSPYDVARVARTTAAAAAYADVPASLEALADALTGRAGWPGVLPLDLEAAGWRP